MCSFPIALTLFLAGGALPAAELKPDTLGAFNRYIRIAEDRIDDQIARQQGFLWANTDTRRAALREGYVASEQRTLGKIQVPDGLVHDWVGAVFIPGASLSRTLALVQDYPNHKNLYGPEIIDSRLLGHNGNEFQVRLRMLKKKVLTVVLNTEHDVRYQPVNESCWRSRSYSTRIAEVHDAGRPGERDLPAGTGHGFLWRLNSYWTFQEKDGGTYVECEAVSLTRAVPKGLGWLIDPIVRQLPRESLANTLRATRRALTGESAAP